MNGQDAHLHTIGPEEGHSYSVRYGRPDSRLAAPDQSDDLPDAPPGGRAIVADRPQLGLQPRNLPFFVPHLISRPAASGSLDQKPPVVTPTPVLDDRDDDCLGQCPRAVRNTPCAPAVASGDRIGREEVIAARNGAGVDDIGVPVDADAVHDGLVGPRS
ncbi:hypothetical protein [Streptomyces californicus]|uniref:hypothetical protein n=1 Tax=Streptomyces californicus TaxID=67351 RepID=UPI0037A60991